MKTRIISFFMVMTLSMSFSIFSISGMEITRYVKPGGTGKGTSWADACGSINAALDAIVRGGRGTVYIGPGNYTETVYIPNGSKNISILGGYAENAMEKPDYDKNKVLLSQGKSDIFEFNATGALSCGFNCDSVLISGINIVKGQQGIVMRGSNIKVAHCRISGCVYSGISCDALGNDHYYVFYCEISGCGTGATLNWTWVLDCNIHDNVGLGMNLNSCHVFNSKIYNNVHVDKNSRLTSDGGGIYMASSTLMRCFIMNNICDGHGGGVYLSSSMGNSRIILCIIANNTADEGGGIYSYDGATIEACTIVNNKASDFGGGICIGKYGSEKMYMTSSILWNNTAKGVVQQYGIQNNRTFEITQSAVQGGGILPETDAENGIIDVSPKNVDTSKPCVALTNTVSFSGRATTAEQQKQIFAQDFTPTVQSACIGRGSWFSDMEKYDIKGNPRILETGKLDMGAIQHGN